MDLNSLHVAIGRGEGLVARTGDVVMYIADAASAAPLLRAFDSAASAQSPARALAKSLVSIALGPDSGVIPAFGVLAPTADGFLLILRGNVLAVIDADGASRTLTGARAVTWVDETVPEPVDRIAIHGGNASEVTGYPHSNLRSGVVPGGGLVVQRAAAAAAAPQPMGEPARPVERQRLPEPPPGRPAAAMTRRPRPPDPPVDKPPRRPADPTAIARPTIGALSVDDEAVYPLDRPYVIGRNPLIDKLVRDAVASPIFLPDAPQISRVHAYVTVDAGAVLVRDAGTPGGTYVAAPGDQSWTKVGDRPTEVRPGWCIRIGERILSYQKAITPQ